LRFLGLFCSSVGVWSLFFLAFANLILLNFKWQDFCHEAECATKLSAVSSFPIYVNRVQLEQHKWLRTVRHWIGMICRHLTYHHLPLNSSRDTSRAQQCLVGKLHSDSNSVPWWVTGWEIQA
jgi:hypothetical protein